MIEMNHKYIVDFSTWKKWNSTEGSCCCQTDTV